jgi:hypothetical protein
MPVVASVTGNNANPPSNDAPAPVDPRLSKAVARLNELGRQLRGIGAAGAAIRIESAAEKAVDDTQTVSFDDLERFIDPELVIDERADACGRLRPKKDTPDTSGTRPSFSRLLGLRRSARLAHWARNTAALLPLIFTWSLLGWAAWEYELDLHSRTGDLGKPFLLLWQQGFADHFLPFGWVAAIDAIFLLGVVALTWWVHRVEKSAEEFTTSLWDAVGGLEEAMGGGAGRSPVTAEDWAQKVDRIIRQAFSENKKMAEESKETLRAASAQIVSAQAQTQALIQAMQAGSEKLVEGLQAGNQAFLAEFQTRTQETIGQFSEGVLTTLQNVRAQNETFIKNTREANERVLDDLVKRQITPLVTKLTNLLDQFGTQQESYTAAATRLAEGVSAIAESAGGMARNSEESTGSTRSIAGSLQEMASSQERFADQVRESAGSMTTAAASMAEVKDTLRAVLVDSADQMAGNITNASASLAQTQAGLAATTAAFREAAADFRESTSSPAQLQAIPAGITQLPEVIARLTEAVSALALASTRRRRWWQRRRSYERQLDGFGGR